jgi:anthranilate synthase component 2
MTALIIDNYDSFTYNLYQQVGRLSGKAPVVYRNDAIAIKEIIQLRPAHIILSPGPGNPSRNRDFGICADIIQELSPTTPTLGVCLGHQGIIAQLGGKIISAPSIVHGKVHQIHHQSIGLFTGIESPMDVMRYHSLIGDPNSLPSSLEVQAQTSDGVIMAVSHKEWPLFGLQFHPESIGTPLGDHLIRNFLEI